MQSKTFYGWWVTAAAFLTFGIAVGLPYYNMPFFYDYFQREFHWTKGQITFGFPLAALLTLWIGPVLVPRFSPRKLILVGTALTCAAFVGFGTMGGALWVYYALWFLYTVGYILSGPIPHQLDHLSLVPAQSRQGHGHRVCRRRADRVPRLVRGEAAHRRNQFPHGPDRVGRADVPGVADGALRDSRSRRGQGALSGWRQPAARGERRCRRSASAICCKQYSFWLLLIGSFCSIGAIGAVNFHMKFVFLDQGFSDRTKTG